MSSWDENYKAARRIGESMGICVIPRWYVDSQTGLKLGVWAAEQRKLKREKALPAELMRKLDDIGFFWDVDDETDPEPTPAEESLPYPVTKTAILEGGKTHVITLGPNESVTLAPVNDQTLETIQIQSEPTTHLVLFPDASQPDGLRSVYVPEIVSRTRLLDPTPAPGQRPEVQGSDLLGECERIVKVLRKMFPQGALPDNIYVTLAPMRADSRVECPVWKEVSENRYNIGIMAKVIDMGKEATVQYILHALVHISNCFTGVKDLSRHGTYHNKKFTAAAECAGLLCRKSDDCGSEVYAVSSQIKVLIDHYHLGECFGSQSMEKYLSTTWHGKKTHRHTKFVCPTCGSSILSTRKDALVACVKCHPELEKWKLIRVDPDNTDK